MSGHDETWEWDELAGGVDAEERRRKREAERRMAERLNAQAQDGEARDASGDERGVGGVRQAAGHDGKPLAGGGASGGGEPRARYERYGRLPPSADHPAEYFPPAFDPGEFYPGMPSPRHAERRAAADGGSGWPSREAPGPGAGATSAVGETGGRPSRAPSAGALASPGAAPRAARRTFRVTSGAGGRKLQPAGGVLLVILIGFALAALLGAAKLTELAEDQPLGVRRDMLVALVRPISGVSSLLRFDEPTRLVNALLGRGEREESGLHHQTGPGGRHTPSPAATPSGTSSPSSSPSAPAWVPSRKEPLALWVGGDSMAMIFGQSLLAMAGKTKVIEAVLDYHVSSGLSRPDFFNWPKRLRAEMKSFDPDAVAAVFGANDGQNVEYQGRVLQFASPEWIALYRKRVGAAMDILVGGSRHRQVWWVGMPIARDSRQSAIYRTLNKAYQKEAAKRPDVRYVDTYAMFSDKNGEYADYLVGLSGKTELMRQEDGIHWSRAGGDLAAAAVLDEIRSHWRIK